MAAELEALQQSGYSVFCVVEVGKLPTPCSSAEERDARGLPEYWWNEADLIHGKGNGKVSWENFGSGIRLNSKSSSNQTVNDSAIVGMTDEEMLQMAMEASMQNEQQKSEVDIKAKVELTPEPSLGEEGVVRVRFRLPDNKLVTRRFFKTDLVDLFYVFVDKCCHSQDKKLEMRAGYPLNDVKAFLGKTIEAANLAGEVVHCQHL